MGNPAGAAATVFPEMGALLVPYLVKDYKSAYAMLNGKIGDSFDKIWQDKYKVKALCFFDYGFRHFWTAKAPIIEPKDLRGKKIRVQQAKIFGEDSVPGKISKEAARIETQVTKPIQWISDWIGGWF